MRNIIDAVINIVNNPITEIKEYSVSHNRANNMGEALEEYVKDVFAYTVGESNQTVRNRKIQEVFSYLGNQNNPPDCMLTHGDAIEVKKIENGNAPLALNSSYPKSKLYRNSSMITEACRSARDWGDRTERDIIFAVGVCNNNLLSSLSMVYGVDYAASAGIYERVANAIRDGISTIQDVELADTNELGRVNRVDPLGITYLRIRGMWGIENPNKAFSYIYSPNNERDFNLMVLINTDKYLSLEHTDQLELLATENKNLYIADVEIRNPDNPAELRRAKLITFSCDVAK